MEYSSALCHATEKMALYWDPNRQQRHHHFKWISREAGRCDRPDPPCDDLFQNSCPWELCLQAPLFSPEQSQAHAFDSSDRRLRDRRPDADCTTAQQSSRATLWIWNSDVYSANVARKGVATTVARPLSLQKEIDAISFSTASL